MSNAHAKFLTGNLTNHIVTMSMTASLGFLALFVVDLVDMIFISLLGVEELAAAVGFSGSILFFTTSVSIGMSIAAGALIAKALGEDKEDRAREILTHALMLGLIITGIIAALVYFNLNSLTALVGASGVTQELSVSYLKIIVPTMPFLMTGIVASAALRSHGAARLSMNVTLTAGIVNAVLDPIFIFGLDMGLDGAAVASAISRMAMAAVALWPIFKKFGGLAGVSVPQFVKDLNPICVVAIPAILANIATPIGGAYVTRMSAEFGEAAVAGMAIIGRLTPIAFALVFAMSGAIGPIIGQNFGAKQYDRVRTAFNQSIVLTIYYVFAVVIVLFLLREPIARLFSVEGTAKDLVFLFCGPLSLAWIFNGIIFSGNAAYNNLGHPFYSTWVNWGRNTLGIIPFVYFGSRIWGAEGVLIGQMMGGVFAALISWLLAQRIMKRMRVIETPNLKGPAFGHHERDFKVMHHRR